MGNWKQQALCARVVDPPDFYATTADGIATAKSFCDACPVRTECLEFAMEDEMFHTDKMVSYCGVWGGTSGVERVSIRNARKQKEG